MFLLLVFYISVISRVTNSHWVNPCKKLAGRWRFIYRPHKNFPFVGVLDNSRTKGHQGPLD